MIGADSAKIVANRKKVILLMVCSAKKTAPLIGHVVSYEAKSDEKPHSVAIIIGEFRSSSASERERWSVANESAARTANELLAAPADAIRRSVRRLPSSTRGEENCWRKSISCMQENGDGKNAKKTLSRTHTHAHVGGEQKPFDARQALALRVRVPF